MNIADKVLRAKDDFDAVFDAGKQVEYDRFWDSFQKNGTRVNYWYGFTGYGWTPKTLNPKYPVNIVDTYDTAQYGIALFARANSSANTSYPDKEYINFNNIADKFDFSQLRRADNLFDSAKFINVIADLSGCFRANYAFGTTWGGGIRSLKLKVSEELQTVTAMFTNSQLSKIEMMEGSVWAVSISFTKCPLDKASFISIVGSLSTTTSGLTVTFNKAAINSAFGINVDDPSTYPEGSEFYTLRNRRANWTFSYGS